MARNKITFEKEYMDDGRWEYRFTGSLREPTLTEAMNFIVESRLWDEIDDIFGVTYIRFKSEEWLPPEESKTLVFMGYDDNRDSCPICGHERDMGGNVCPVCLKKW